MKNRNQELLNTLNNKNLWRIPKYSDLMRATGIKSKNGIFKALRVLQKQGKLDKDFKPI